MASIGGDSETTVEIKIKTLDSQTYTLRVDKCVPVPALKEQIATVTGVLSEQQRLICRGKVLKDDQLLSAYHVEDGHTLHLVVRQPHQSASTSYMGPEGVSGLPGSSSAPGNTHNRSSPVAHSFVFESVNVDQGDIDNSLISRIISSMLDSIGPTSARTGNTANDLREMISERLASASSDGGISDSTYPHPNPSNSQRGSRFPSMTPLGPQNPAVIPDSLTTLNQYISFMKDEYRREEISANGASGTHLNEEQNHDSHSHFAQGGLPTPASLAEIVLSTRRLLMEQTGESLSQLARQLEGHTNVTDLLTRMNMQSSAIRSGVLMRNLGSMLLELGRTTMTLRMGQSPAEAIVNAGPATFVSANGPTPLLVQPVPFYPGPNTTGIHVGPANPSIGLEGEQPDAAAAAAFVPRNIEIRIRTVGRAVPVVSTGNANDQPSSQQQHEQTDPLRNSSGGGESGVRVVPLRTVVTVPSGVNSSPTDPSSNPVRLMYPILARVRQQSISSASDSRGSQDRQQTENSESRDDGRTPPSSTVPVPVVSGVNIPSNESGTYQGFARVYVSSRQSLLNNDSNGSTQADVDAIRNDGSHDTSGVGSEQGVFLSNVLRTQADVDAIRNDGSHDTSGVGSEQGVFFSNVLRQIMPFLSQGSEDGASTNILTSTAQVERGNLDGSSSSRHCRDPPESPSSKRMKKE